MFENLNRFFFKVSMIIFFIIGITLFFISENEITVLMKLAERSYLNSHSIHISGETSGNKEILGSEIITQKISFNEIAIVVEGEEIKKMDDLLTIQTEGKYLREVIFDKKGAIIFINYREK